MESCSSWGWKGPQELCPTPAQKKCQLRAIIRALFCQFSFKGLPGWKYHSIPGKSIPVFDHCHGEKLILISKWIFFYTCLLFLCYTHLLFTLHTSSWSLSSPCSFFLLKWTNWVFFSVSAHHEIQLFNHPRCSSLDSNISRFSCADQPKTGPITPHTKV